MWMGILCGVALGAVIVLLLRERRNGGGQLGGPINIWNVGSGAQHPMMAPAAAMMLPAGNVEEEIDPGLKNKMGTVTLSETSSNRLLRASGRRRWSVHVRTIGPPGAYGMFGTEPDRETGGNVSPNSIAVPAGDDHKLELEPGDYLFARGSTSGVVVSYTARQLA